MTLSKKEFLTLMKFPNEWDKWDMYPEDLAEIQIAHYKPGNERSSEHFRFGAFRWWEVYANSKEDLKKLVALSYLDSDQGMASHARERMKESKFFDEEIELLIKQKMGSD